MQTITNSEAQENPRQPGNAVFGIVTNSHIKERNMTLPNQQVILMAALCLFWADLAFPQEIATPSASNPGERRGEEPQRQLLLRFRLAREYAPESHPAAN